MVIVVTGGIGSGKSVASRILSDRYALALYDADSKVKELYARYPEIVVRLEDVLGETLRDKDGVFQPHMLASVMFADRSNVAAVENVVFPYLKNDFREFLEKHDNRAVFESATVLEKEAFSGFGDLIILIDAPVGLRLRRASDRDGASREDVISRMDKQPLMNAISEGTAGSDTDASWARALSRIDHIIENTGSVSQLEDSLFDVMDRFMNIN